MWEHMDHIGARSEFTLARRKLPARGSAGESVATPARVQEDDVRVPDLINHFLQKQDGLGILPLVGLNGYG